MKYLSSLITIPKLSQAPPDFLSNGPPTQPSKSKKKDFDQEKYLADLERQRREQEDADMERAKELSRQMEQDRLNSQQMEQDRRRREQAEKQRQQELLRQQNELQQQLEMQRRAEMQRQAEEERQRQLFLQQQQSQMQHMEQQMLQQRYMELSRGEIFFNLELENSRSLQYRDKSALEEANLKLRHLENQLAQLNLHNATHDASLQDELNQWKQKYEALAKLYAQLRKEHLELLTKFKDIKDAGTKISDEARREVERIRAELKVIFM